MDLTELKQHFSKYKKRKRVGRGDASGKGHTAGRGHKGAKARSGTKLLSLREGGQMPFTRRIPKRGFNNAVFRKEYNIINVKLLEERFNNGDTVDKEKLIEMKIIKNEKYPLKVLGNGELTKSLTVKAAKFSTTAKEKIEKAGGKVIIEGE